MKEARTVFPADARAIALALKHLRGARTLLIFAEAHQAAKAVAKAIKSVEGARRHAENLLARHPTREPVLPI